MANCYSQISFFNLRIKARFEENPNFPKGMQHNIRENRYVFA